MPTAVAGSVGAASYAALPAALPAASTDGAAEIVRPLRRDGTTEPAPARAAAPEAAEAEDDTDGPGLIDDGSWFETARVVRASYLGSYVAFLVAIALLLVKIVGLEPVDTAGGGNRSDAVAESEGSGSQCTDEPTASRLSVLVAWMLLAAQASPRTR